MNKPTVKIITTLPAIGIPNDPIVVYNGNALLLCYETTHSNENYAVIRFDNVIEYCVRSINDEGLGKHKYAAYGLKFYSIHELDNIEETISWSALAAKYWIFCFKDRTVEVLGTAFNVIEKSYDMRKLNIITTDFINAGL